MASSLQVRRGYAMKKMLEQIAGNWGEKNGLLKINPDEIIVGTMPPYSVGQGKEVMDYLKDASDDWDERLQSEMNFLNPWSNFGHICPDFQKVVERGLVDIIEQCEHRMKSSAAETERDFLTSVVAALEGVIRFAQAYAERADEQVSIHKKQLEDWPTHPDKKIIEERIAGMAEVAERLRRIPAEPCKSFADAVQCIFILNCVLHWTGELTSLGRLDQILFPFYEKDSLSREQAQEIIDCFWVKLDEQVVLDNRLLADHFTEADGALLGAGGPSNFDQGALSNQWMQQVTIGGVVATNEKKTQDACNEVTRMVLDAARKFPFNCPTVDLRVHKNTPEDILDLAAKTLLSGGAHPVLLNDDKLVPALKKSGKSVELRSARNYACDGCYETIFPGETEFSFIYVPGVDVLEKTLNSGAGFIASGETFLRGTKSSFRTPEAANISSFEQLYEILEEHIWLSVNRQLSGLFRAYGSKAAVCPSPILSALIDGCLESGRDFYDGGAKYHMFAPLMTGISTVADSLYVIDHLVFGETALSLEELTACLRSDWGARPNVIGRKMDPERAKYFREICLNQPKFGFGEKEVDTYAWRVANSFVDAVEKALKHPVHTEAIKKLKSTFGTKEKPFNIVITPGVGTFEQYNFGGSFAGATPDGRMAGDPLASDLAASPLPKNVEPNVDAADGAWTDENNSIRVEIRRVALKSALKSWNNKAFSRFADGAPSDFNIEEDFPHDELVKVLKAFADGKGSNVMTVTAASLKTLKAAEETPLDYNLLRVRMGGWTEFFSVLFPDHKKQHIRRPIYTA